MPRTAASIISTARFPGANGLQTATPADYDAAGSRRLACCGAAADLGRADGRRRNRTVTEAQTAHLPNAPFAIDDPNGFNVPASVVTRDLVAPLLPEPDADQRRQERPLRRLVGRRRAGHGLLRRLEAAAVEGRQAIHAGRQFLHGRVRRLVPQPLLAGLRLHAALSERRPKPGQGQRSARSSRRRDAEDRAPTRRNRRWTARRDSSATAS